MLVYLFNFFPKVILLSRISQSFNKKDFKVLSNFQNNSFNKNSFFKYKEEIDFKKIIKSKMEIKEKQKQYKINRKCLN
jgi:hypothetical protein